MTLDEFKQRIVRQYPFARLVALYRFLLAPGGQRLQPRQVQTPETFPAPDAAIGRRRIRRVQDRIDQRRKVIHWPLGSSTGFQLFQQSLIQRYEVAYVVGVR